MQPPGVGGVYGHCGIASTSFGTPKGSRAFRQVKTADGIGTQLNVGRATLENNLRVVKR